MATVNTALDLNIVDTHNLKTIGVADVSIYKPNISITGATIEITPPGYNKVALNFNPNSVNIFNSNNLQITNSLNIDTLSSLPDGIWVLKYSITPALDNFVELTFMRVDLITCMYNKAKLSLDLSDCSYCEEYKTLDSELREIAVLISGAVASANQCDEISATKKYKKAMQKLKRLRNCECK